MHNHRRMPFYLKVFLMAVLLSLSHSTYAQFYSVQTNALGLVTGNINAEVSMALNERWSIHLPIYYNPITFADNKKMKHLSALLGVRYWQRESYGQGFFFGGNSIVSKYNIGGLFGSKYRYQGMAYGLGLSAGYSIPIRSRWNIEFELGGGAVWSNREKYGCKTCATKIEERSGVWLVPDKAAVSVVYLF